MKRGNAKKEGQNCHSSDMKEGSLVTDQFYFEGRNIRGKSWAAEGK